MQKCLQFLDYAESQEVTIVAYRASNMRLGIHSNALYQSEPKACSKAGSHMFMAGMEDIPINYGMVINTLQIIRAVMLSAAEAELGVLFINTKISVSIWQKLEEMGNPQTRTFIQSTNSTAHTLLNNKILPKAPKAMDMQFHWLRCREAQDQYQIFWRPGTQNLVDYWTKYHPASHHKAFWPQILTSATTNPKGSKLSTPKNTATKSFVKNILLALLFVEQ